MAEWTADDVRQIIAGLASRLNHVETHWAPENRATPKSTTEVLRVFDAAMSAHDAEIRAQALEDFEAGIVGPAANAEASQVWMIQRSEPALHETLDPNG